MDLIKNGFENFLGQFGNLLPGVLGAIVVLIVGWLIASGVSKLVGRLLNKTNLDNRLMGKSTVSSERFISKLVYYLLMIIVLMVVLEMLGVKDVLDPLKDMVGRFFSAIPTILKAVIIGFVGYILATMASEVVNVGGNFIERTGQKLGLSADVDLSSILKKLVFIIIFIPILIIAIDELGLNAISDPLKGVLTTFLEAIPKILFATVIIGVFYIGGRFVSGLLTDLLGSLGTDDLPNKLRLGSVLGEGQSLSKLLGNLAFFFIMFMGVLTGVERLGFDKLVDILNNVFEMSGQIFFGLVMLAIGNWIANIAHDALSRGDTSPFLASVVRVAILGLFLAISLKAMGIADEIVTLAFGLTLGAIAVAVALSFGLGGREAAGKEMERIFKKFRDK